MRTLEKITIQNVKSIREQHLELGKLNLFIGGNGAGKSNLIQVFRFLREIAQQNLANYSLERGADSLLYFGRKTSKFMEFYLEFGEQNVNNAYRIRRFFLSTAKNYMVLLPRIEWDCRKFVLNVRTSRLG